MKKFFLILLASSFFSGVLFAQADNLPTKEWNAGAYNPYVLYISGDGGFNRFSTDLCTDMNKAGYGVTAINAKSYFWDKKTPEETATAIQSYLARVFKNRLNQQLVLVGYSFGADVMSFIVNRLPASMQIKLVSVILLAPSTSTDFEIHWSDIFGGHIKRSMDVVEEINKMNVARTVIILGEDDMEYFPVNKVRLKNFVSEILPGSHHFSGDTDKVAGTMMKYFK
ncbi:MAG: virulence factor family protein [Bacteroidetes bacterium]|nr:virulence factor family protein [Bacteroidota bacterium]MBS1930236.1 virulence factor family protein [Bacteroidota bacterium]